MLTEEQHALARKWAKRSQYMSILLANTAQFYDIISKIIGLLVLLGSSMTTALLLVNLIADDKRWTRLFGTCISILITVLTTATRYFQLDQRAENSRLLSLSHQSFACNIEMMLSQKEQHNGDLFSKLSQSMLELLGKGQYIPYYLQRRVDNMVDGLIQPAERLGIIGSIRGASKIPVDDA